MMHVAIVINVIHDPLNWKTFLSHSQVLTYGRKNRSFAFCEICKQHKRSFFFHFVRFSQRFFLLFLHFLSLVVKKMFLHSNWSTEKVSATKSLPIEINIPKRFVNEGNFNILHWRGAKREQWKVVSWFSLDVLVVALKERKKEKSY